MWFLILIVDAAFLWLVYRECPHLCVCVCVCFWVELNLCPETKRQQHFSGSTSCETPTRTLITPSQGKQIVFALRLGNSSGWGDEAGQPGDTCVGEGCFSLATVALIVCFCLLALLFFFLGGGGCLFVLLFVCLLVVFCLFTCVCCRCWICQFLKAAMEVTCYVTFAIEHESHEGLAGHLPV